jgi:hypothetical protein
MRSPAVVTLAAAAAFSGCLLPQSNGTSDGGTSSPWTANRLEITVSGVHFTSDAPVGSASLVNSQDTSGNVNSSFQLSASGAGAGCNLRFDRFGASSGIGVGQYTVESNVGTATGSGQVYPTVGEEIDLPAANGGSAHCSGSACDNAAFVINGVDAQHVYGYWMGQVQSDQGLGVADVVCTFYVPMTQYQP